MSDKPIKILLIEDNPNDIQLIKRALGKARGATFDLVSAARLCEGLAILARGGIDVILLDLGLPDSREIETFTRAYAQAKDVPIVILSGLEDESLAIETLSKGAQDYLVKGQLGSNLLTRSINYAIGRKKTEQNLFNEKERLSVTLRSIGDGVITTDMEGKIVMINKVAEILTGWTHEEAKDKPLDEVFHIINERTGKRCENSFEKVVKTGGIVGLANHTIIVSRDGTERLLDDSGAPIRDKEGHIIGTILVFRDITEKQKMEEEIQKIQKLESVGVLAGGIAHDFNNILSAILTNIQIAKMQKGEDISQHLEKVEKAIYRATNLTHQLLTFAKGGAPIKKLVSVIELLQEAAIFVLHGSNVACEFSIAEDLWPVECDKTQISQVINNLIINAREAMPEGGRVMVSAKNLLVEKGEDLPAKEGKYIKISIKDEGIGIPKENMARIFDPFFTTKHEGDGLGLASAYSIITKHDGHIEVQSELGVGTTFHVYLPAREGKIAIKEKKVGNISCGQGRILLMDDEEIVLEATGEVLKYLGFEVEFARNGQEAIKLYKKAKESKQPIELVIMDLTIPGGMGGKETISKLKEIYPGIKAIVFSGYSNDPVMSDPEKYGFCGVLNKPYKIKEMSNVLQKLLLQN